MGINHEIDKIDKCFHKMFCFVHGVKKKQLLFFGKEKTFSFDE